MVERPTIGLWQSFATIVVVFGIVFAGLVVYVWHDERSRRRAEEAAEAAEAARNLAWSNNPRSRIDGITTAHPTTAPRDRLIAAIEAAERGETVCAPLVLVASRANWFFPERIDEFAVLLLASDSLPPPVVEWRQRVDGVAGEPIPLTVRPFRAEMSLGVSFLHYKAYCRENLRFVEEDDIPRPTDDLWIRENGSHPYGDFSGVEVRVRSDAAFGERDWIPVEVTTDEMAARVTEQFRARNRYTRP